MGYAIGERSSLAVILGLLITTLVAADDTSSPVQTISRLPQVIPPLVVFDLNDSGGLLTSFGADTASPGYAGHGVSVLANTSDSDSVSTDCAVDECDDDCGGCSWWSVRAGAVVLRRVTNNAIPLVAGAPAYSTADLGFSYEPGPLLSVIRHGVWQSEWDLEATYFGVNDFEGTAATGAFNTLFTTPPINAGPIPASTLYTSRFDSTEFNLRRQSDSWLTWLGGFRWIELGENLTTDLGGVSTHAVNVNNHMYGLQLGADALLYRRNSLSVEALSKVGIFANNSDSLTTTANIGGALPAIVANRDRAAFLGELGVTGVYDLNDRWSFRGGYQLLWLDGVALSTEQLDDVDLVTGVANVDIGQTALYHGFTFAGQFVW